MTTTDTIILCVSIFLVIAPLAYLAGWWSVANRQPVSKCCGCGKLTTGLKCDECADFTE